MSPNFLFVKGGKYYFYCLTFVTRSVHNWFHDKVGKTDIEDVKKGLLINYKMQFGGGGCP